MIFNHISNIPAFFRCVNSCSGDVAFVDESGKVRDLKKLAAKGALPESMVTSGQICNLEVLASTLEDRKKLIWFMHQMTA